MPRGKTYGAGVNLGGLVYIVGGSTSAGTADTVSMERYDPFSNEWSTLAPLNTPRFLFLFLRVLVRICLTISKRFLVFQIHFAQCCRHFLGCS